MNVAIVMRKNSEKTLVNNLQGTVVVKVMVLLKACIYSISVSHKLLLGNQNDAIDMDKNFLLMSCLIYLRINAYHLYMLGYTN